MTHQKTLTHIYLKNILSTLIVNIVLISGTYFAEGRAETKHKRETPIPLTKSTKTIGAFLVFYPHSSKAFIGQTMLKIIKGS